MSQLALECLEVVDLDDPRGLGGSTGAPMLPSRGSTPPSIERHHRLVDAAVVAVVVDEDLRPAGDLARDPDHEPVRVRGRERELPLAQAEASLHLLADRDRVLGRQHRRDPARDPLAHRGDRRRRRVARHSPGVAEAEVGVDVAVDVGRPRHPRRESKKTGKLPGQRVIQFIGTPESSDAPARSCSSRERGWLDRRSAPLALAQPSIRSARSRSSRSSIYAR